MNTLCLLRGVGLAAGAALLCSGYSAFAAAAGGAMPEFQSNIKISGRTAGTKGSEAGEAARTQEPKRGAGIEELFYTKELSKNTTMVLEGRALGGAEGYLVSYKLTKTEVGSLDVG